MFDVPAMLAALKAKPASTTGPTIGEVNDATSHNPLKDLGGAVKNIVDFVETPFYMLTNTVDSHFEREDNGSEANSLGSYLDDIRQGVQRGIDAGINHVPAYTKDWIDVIKHAQKGTPDEGNDLAANLVGGAADLIVDPLNLIPGAGVGKSLIKAPGVIAGAIREAGKVGETALAKGTEAAAKTAPDALARAAVRPAEGTAEALGA